MYVYRVIKTLGYGLLFWKKFVFSIPNSGSPPRDQKSAVAASTHKQLPKTIPNNSNSQSNQSGTNFSKSVFLEETEDESMGTSIQSKTPVQPAKSVQRTIASSSNGPKPPTSQPPSAGVESKSQNIVKNGADNVSNKSNQHADLTVVTVDSANKKYTNDLSKYSAEEIDNTITYKFNDGNKCVEVKFDGKQVWTYTGVPKDAYPKYIYYRKDVQYIIFEFVDCFYLFGCKLGKFKLITKDRFNNIFNSFRVVTRSGSNLLENNTGDYDLKHYGFIIHFKFKEGKRCTHVKFKDTNIWSHTDGETNNYPSQLYVDLLLSKIDIVINEKQNSYNYEFKDEDFADKVQQNRPSSFASTYLSQAELSKLILSQQFDKNVDSKGFGISFSGLKFVDLSLWDNGFGTPDLNTPLINRQMFAFAHKDKWMSGFTYDAPVFRNKFLKLPASR